jgi:hypothetical protein
MNTDYKKPIFEITYRILTPDSHTYLPLPFEHKNTTTLETQFTPPQDTRQTTRQNTDKECNIATYMKFWVTYI